MRLAVNSLNNKKTSLGVEWYRAGIYALERGAGSEAVEDFENALAFNSSYEYRLKLAEALVAAGRLPEAQARLISLYDARPGDANISLQLARLYAAGGDVSQAQRFYESAIYGVWQSPQDSLQKRLSVRAELANFLVASGRRADAQAQLISLSAEAPQTVDAHLQLARMFLGAGAPRNAFAEANAARLMDKTRADAVALQGEAAFAINDFAAADKWLSLADSMAPGNLTISSLHRRAQSVVAADPFAKGVQGQRRAQRIVDAYRVADDRLERCNRETPFIAPKQGGTPQPRWADLQRWAEQLRPAMVPRKVLREDDLQEAAMRFIFSVEQATRETCGVPRTDTDDSLYLLSRQRWSSE